MEIIVYLVLFVVGALVGQFIYNVYRTYRAIKEMDEKFIQAIEKKLEDSIKAIEVDIEKHQDVFYLYNRENSEFVAQGKNKDELVEAINQRFKGYRILAHEEQLKQLGLDW